MSLAARPGAQARALSVAASVTLTVPPDAIVALASVGSLPSSVKCITAAGSALVIVTARLTEYVPEAWLITGTALFQAKPAALMDTGAARVMVLPSPSWPALLFD